MKCCVIPPYYSVLRRFGSWIGPELQYPPVEGGRSRNIRDQEHGSALVELLWIAGRNIWHCALSPSARSCSSNVQRSRSRERRDSAAALVRHPRQATLVSAD